MSKIVLGILKSLSIKIEVLLYSGLRHSPIKEKDLLPYQIHFTYQAYILKETNHTRAYTANVKSTVF